MSLNSLEKTTLDRIMAQFDSRLSRVESKIQNDKSFSQIVVKSVGVSTLDTEFRQLDGMRIETPDFGKRVRALIHYNVLYTMSHADPFLSTIQFWSYLNGVPTADGFIYCVYFDGINAAYQSDAVPSIVTLEPGVNVIQVMWRKSQASGADALAECVYRSLSCVVFDD